MATTAQLLVLVKAVVDEARKIRDDMAEVVGEADKVLVQLTTTVEEAWEATTAGRLGTDDMLIEYGSVGGLLI